MTPWLILRPVTGWELKAVSSLKEAGYNAYCPVQTVINRLIRTGDAIRHRALFPGYVFCEIPDHPKHLYRMIGARMLEGVCGFHWAHGPDGKRPATISGKVITGLMAAEAAGAFDDTAPRPKWKPKKGDTVEVTAGPFEGFVGQVVGLKGKRRLMLFVEMFDPYVQARRQKEIDVAVANVRAA